MGLLRILHVSVDKPADQNVENDNKDHAKRGDEEPSPLLTGVPLPHLGAEPTDEVEPK